MRKFLGVLVALCCMVITAHANSFLVTFDNSLSSPPGIVVGTGTFSFTGSFGDGTYHLDALPGYNISFTVGASTFTNADINTSIPDVLVTIYGGGVQFYFDNDGVFGSHGGSLDFDKADGSFLTTEPNYFGSPPLNLYEATDSVGNSYFGVFEATGPTVPEPSSLLLLGCGILGTAAVLRRKLFS